MNTPSLPAETSPGAAEWDPERVFFILGNDKRRRLLVALAAVPGQAASQLAPLIGRTQDATLKHLIELREAGMVRMARDPHDERRQLYTLTPAISIQRTAAALELDFGCCLMRVRG